MKRVSCVYRAVDHFTRFFAQIRFDAGGILRIFHTLMNWRNNNVGQDCGMCFVVEKNLRPKLTNKASSCGDEDLHDQVTSGVESACKVSGLMAGTLLRSTEVGVGFILVSLSFPPVSSRIRRVLDVIDA